MDMDDDLKSTIISEIGKFSYGTTNWLEFQAKMDRCFDECQYSHGKKEICLEVIGGKTLRILKAIIRPQNIQDEEVDYEMIIAKLEAHFYPNPNRPYYVSKFLLRRQKKDETFFRYVSELRKLIVNCGFGKGQQSKLRNQIVEGSVTELKEKFNHNMMSLSQVFEVGLLWDDSKKFKEPPHPRNHKARKNRVPTCLRCKENIINLHNSEPCPFDWAVCSYCNVKGHVSVACKYKDINCNKCNQQGHIAKLCKKKEVKLDSVQKENGSLD
ncbi:hypothetical protein JTB14_035917 [Gonioctena quinquepunctata]|nr:hypothetical protein JTB14_035917 [Gonioctena quinquepunctata]